MGKGIKKKGSTFLAGAITIAMIVTGSLCGMPTRSVEAADNSTLTEKDLTDGLGFAKNFSVFAKDFYQENHMEGAVCVQTLQSHSAAFTNTTNVNEAVTNYSVNVTKFCNVETDETFHVALFTKSADGTYQIVSGTTKDIKAGETVSYQSLSKSNTYYVFEVDDSGKQLKQGDKLGNYEVSYDSDSPVKIGSETTKVSAVNNISYIEHIGANVQSTLNSINTTSNDPVIAYGGSNTISGNNQFQVIDSETGGSMQFANENEKNNVVILTDDEFPVDFDTEFTNLNEFSKTLSNASSGAKVKVINLTASNGSINWDAALSQLGLSDKNDLGNRGITLANDEYVIFNVKSLDGSDINLNQNIRINGKQGQDWDTSAGRVIWNYYGEDSDGNYSPYKGTVTMGVSTAGTQLAPEGSVTLAATSYAQLIAATVSNINGEIHFSPFDSTSEDSTTTKITVNNTAPTEATTEVTTTEATTTEATTTEATTTEATTTEATTTEATTTEATTTEATTTEATTTEATTTEATTTEATTTEATTTEATTTEATTTETTTTEATTTEATTTEATTTEATTTEATTTEATTTEATTTEATTTATDEPYTGTTQVATSEATTSTDSSEEYYGGTTTAVEENSSSSSSSEEDEYYDGDNEESDSESNSESEESDVAETGDNNDVALLLLGLGVSLGVIPIVLRKRH